jgi:hypothetical protein
MGAAMRKILLSFGILFVLLAFVCQAGAFELSADMITKDGDQKQSGKLYVKGNKYRIEMKNGSEYAIIRHDKNKSWIVIPDQKAYIEMPFDPKKKPAIEEKQSHEGSRKFLGSEVIDGRETKKYQVSAKEGGANDSFYQWIATDLNFPVKTMALNGSWSIEYRNIKTSVPDSLFEIPESYEKINMPSNATGEVKRSR